MRSSLVVSALQKEHGKESVPYKNGNAAKRSIFQSVVTPDNRKEAPLAVNRTVSPRTEPGVVVESRVFEILTNKTLNWRKEIHSTCSKLIPVHINNPDKY